MSVHEAPARTQKQRWASAVKAVRAEGVVILQNVKKCCRNCINYELGERVGDGGHFAFTYGSQGSGTFWEDDVLMVRGERHFSEDRPAEGVYWYFNDEVAGQAIKKAFEAESFTVDWDGSGYQAPEIIVNKEVK